MDLAKNFLHGSLTELEAQHKIGPGKYEYIRRKFVPLGCANQCVVSVYEIPPGKSAYPYHYHLKNEETFLSLAGKGF